jgi:tetratricopeptide (TPR) repeat protein
MQIEPCEADQFFKGNSYGWGAIEKNYDCKRLLNDSILSDGVLLDETERNISSDFYFLGGHAGAGKTCTLKRIAWDAAIEFEKICIFIDSPSKLNLKPIIEIAEKCGERIYLFIDKCSLHIGEILYIYNQAKKQNLPVTIIGSERQNEWNIDCTPLHKITSEQWLLPYLKEKEIGSLLDRLTENNCLGLIENLSRKEQESAFREKAGRQLLVALYEVTVSKPFRDIVFDEYKNIEPEKARLIYRTICALNRWGVPVRSGLNHRIFDINYEEFRDKFFLPLEHIVQVRTSNYSDHCYQARHPYIAEFVFEQALQNQQERFDLILTILSCMDIGYGSDYRAFREIIKAKNLIEQFKDPMLIRKIYDQCKEMADNDDFYHQQIAHFEFKRDNPNYTLAEKHLDLAEKLNPSNKSISHSRSLLQFQRGKNASGLERQRLLSSADDYARMSISANDSSEYGYQTICEIALEKLKDLLNDDSIDDLLVNETVKEIEGNLAVGLQRMPGSEFLLSTESKLWELLGENIKAITALEKAFQVNDASPFIASALARIYLKNGKIPESREVLEKLVENCPADKICNGMLGKLISQKFPDEADRALMYLRRSFTDGDSNYTNQFWFARQLYINRDYKEAYDAFNKLKVAPIEPIIKYKIQGDMKASGKLIRLNGRVKKLESTYAFVENANYPGIHFLHKDNMDEAEWDSLTVGRDISYHLGFTFKGPACSDSKIIKNR